MPCAAWPARMMRFLFGFFLHRRDGQRFDMCPLAARPEVSQLRPPRVLVALAFPGECIRSATAKIEGCAKKEFGKYPESTKAAAPCPTHLRSCYALLLVLQFVWCPMFNVPCCRARHK